MTIKLNNLILVPVEPLYSMPCNTAHQQYSLIRKWMKDNTFEKEPVFLNACIYEFALKTQD